MTQADKDLLLKDLCGRLTYGVYDYIGYSYPIKDENGKYKKAWVDLESNINMSTWFDEQNIVEIKDL